MGPGASKMIGESVAFQRVLNAARMVAPTDALVLLTGESGTGKALLAREIHASSLRRGGAFVALHGSAVAAELLETELLECREGPGPLSGEIRRAAGGTLFLDEIAELAPQAQARLLQFLDQRTAGPGSRRCVPDLRVLVATNRDLAGEVREGRFREDLYFRLRVVPLELPPLRERGEDLIPLIRLFTAEAVRVHGRRAPSYSATSRRLLRAYPWPGNLRELRNFCERMVILLPGATVQPENLPAEIRSGACPGSSRLFTLPERGIDLQALERDVIAQAISMSGGNRSRAARLLGISRDTLLYRMQKYAIEA